MKKRNTIRSIVSSLLAGALCLSMAACSGTQTPAEEGTTGKSTSGPRYPNAANKF